MRVSSSLVRVLMKGGSLVLLWLLVPSVATAAAASRRGAPRVCTPQSILTLHTLARVTRLISGPVAHHLSHAVLDLSEGGLRVERGVNPGFADDDAAIQNDAPAPWIDADVRLAFGLEPMGVLGRLGIHQPKAREFTPRSPRGPPHAV